MKKVVKPAVHAKRSKLTVLRVSLSCHTSPFFPMSG